MITIFANARHMFFKSKFKTMTTAFSFAQAICLRHLRNHITDRVTAIVRKIPNNMGDDLLMDQSFRELGMDSLDISQAVVAMEEQLGCEISNEQAYSINTIQQAIDTFYFHLAKKHALLGQNKNQNNQKQ